MTAPEQTPPAPDPTIDPKRVPWPKARRWWYIRYYAITPLVLASTGFSIATQNWPLLVNNLILLAILVISERGGRWAYRHGRSVGIIDTFMVIATVDSQESAEEALKTLGRAYEPWHGVYRRPRRAEEDLESPAEETSE